MNNNNGTGTPMGNPNSNIEKYLLSWNKIPEGLHFTFKK